MSGKVRGLLALALAAAVVVAIGAGKGGKSKLPDFDAVEFSSYRADQPPVRWSGDRAGELRSLFEGIPRDRNPMKWAFQGNLTLFENGEPVGEIVVFGPSGGSGPFQIGENYFLGYDPAAFGDFLEKSAN